MGKNSGFAERIRPSNSGEVGCYTAILIIALIAIRVAIEDQGPAGVIIFLGAIFIYEIAYGWIKNRLSFRETALETSIILAGTAIFVIVEMLFKNLIDTNSVGRGFILFGHFVILGTFLISSYLSTRFVRKKQFWPVLESES